jgi:hypothetical protein
MFPQSSEMSSKEASTPSIDRRHAATRETVPQPRHVARLVFSTTARPSQRCDVTAFHVRSPSAGDARTSVRPVWIGLSNSPKATFDSFYSFNPIPPLPLGHGCGGIPAPRSFGSSAFPFPPKNSPQRQRLLFAPLSKWRPSLWEQPPLAFKSPITGAEIRRPPWAQLLIDWSAPSCSASAQLTLSSTCCAS